MDKAKVLEVAKRYSREFEDPQICGFDLAKKQFERAGPPPTSPEELLKLLSCADVDAYAARMRIQPRSFDRGARGCPTHEDIFAHVMAMVPDTVRFVEEGRIGKAFRWFGFMSGAMLIAEDLVSSLNAGAHILVAAEFAREHAEAERLFDAFVYLGCAQGILWGMGKYSIDELKNHKRPQ